MSPRRKLIPYKPYLKELARKLRNNSTKSEIKLWKVLKGKYRGKYDFHRQKPLDTYIGDFFCHELCLVIEIDGYTHEFEENKQRDYQKECALHQYGLNTLRFLDSEVHQNLAGCIGIIDAYIDGFETGNLDVFLPDSWKRQPLFRGVSHGDWDTPLNPLSRGDFHLCLDE